jgi:ADP-heptose:LPS heptosyltransferase
VFFLWLPKKFIAGLRDPVPSRLIGSADWEEWKAVTPSILSYVLGADTLIVPTVLNPSIDRRRSTTSSLLYICQNALGDVVTSLPSIHFLKRSYRNNLDVCINSDLDQIFAADPHIDRVIAAPGNWFDMHAPIEVISGVTRLPGFRSHYDAVIDTMCVPQTARLIELLQPNAAAGIGFDDTLHVYDHPVSLETWRSWSDERRTACDCFADVIRAWRSGDEYVGTVPVLYVSEAARRWAAGWLNVGNPAQAPLVAINPGAGSPMKRWPLDRYLELGSNLEARGFRSLFIFGPKESALQAQAAPYIAGLNALTYSSPDSRIQNVAALLQQCSLTVSNDCAVMHISAAVGTRTLAIFGPSISKIWFPYNQPWNRVVEREAACRKNCFDGCAEFHCLTDISVEAVLTQAKLMLASQ